MPRMFLRIVERPTTVLLFPVMDYWLRITAETDVLEIYILARVRNQTRNLFGPWIKYRGAKVKTDRPSDVVKFGGYGVRGVFDEVEVHLETIVADGTRFIGETTLPLAGGNSAYVTFQRAA